MKTIVTHSLEETRNLAREWLGSLPIKNDEATVVGLYGNLGSGKTTFTQCLGKELGIREVMTSPTFVIEKFYEVYHPHFKKLIHIDAYRLESHHELGVLNFEEIKKDPQNLIVIEWPENVKEILPENHIKIYCEFIDPTSRQFKLQ